MTKLVKVTLLVTLSCFPAGFGPGGWLKQSEVAYCEGKKCPLWCQFFYLELGNPYLDAPAPHKVFCDDSWAPAREPLRWYRQEKPEKDQ